MKTTISILALCSVLFSAQTYSISAASLVLNEAFDTSSLDDSVWPTYMSWYGGMLSVTNSRLEAAYTGEAVPPNHHPEALVVSQPIVSRTNSFSVVVDVSGEFMMLEVTSSREWLDVVRVSLVPGADGRTYASAVLTSNGWNVAGNQSGVFVPSNSGRFRVDFDPQPGVLKAYFSPHLSSDSGWFLLESFGIAGSGGASGNTQWEMSESDAFLVGLRALLPQPGDYFDNVRLVVGLDDDCDGVPNEVDQCEGTTAGDVVDSLGCSLNQLVPIDGPWRNHGQYVSAFVRAAKTFLAEGRITQRRYQELVSQAAQRRSP